LITNFTECSASWEGQNKKNPPIIGERTNRKPNRRKNRRMIRRNQIIHPDALPSLGRT